jgi:hypothetical protein
MIENVMGNRENNAVRYGFSCYAESAVFILDYRAELAASGYSCFCDFH